MPHAHSDPLNQQSHRYPPPLSHHYPHPMNESSGPISPDGRSQWSGAEWVPLDEPVGAMVDDGDTEILSPDGRYWWDDKKWVDLDAHEAKMRASGPSALTIARGVALGVGAIIGALWFINSLGQPSALDCSIQRVEVAAGDRVGVESGCVGR